VQHLWSPARPTGRSYFSRLWWRLLGLHRGNRGRPGGWLSSEYPEGPAGIALGLRPAFGRLRPAGSQDED
jgi:hypothetical protein